MSFRLTRKIGSSPCEIAEFAMEGHGHAHDDEHVHDNSHPHTLQQEEVASSFKRALRGTHVRGAHTSGEPSEGARDDLGSGITPARFGL